MIKNLGLQNFRVFNEMTNFEFAPITVLTGANNSGKSTVIKALLLLEENAKKNKLFELDFSSEQNDMHKLGSFEDVLNKNTDNNEICFSLKTFENEISDFILFLKYKKNDKIVNLNQVYIQNLDNTEIIFHQNSENKITDYQQNIIFEKFINILNFEFLEVLKANTQRIYLNQWQGTPINGLISKYLKLSDILNTYLETSNYKTKKDFLVKWLGIEGFDLCDDINFYAMGYGTVIKVIKKEKEYDLADLGYGATQILALLLKIITSKTQANIILEEPEINLHPKLQSKLADLLIDAFKNFGQNFIIETHSEYFVRKLQYLTAKKEIEPKDISLYYFNDPDKLTIGDKQIKKIEILKNGFFDEELGTGFFDEADNIAINLHILKNKN